MYLFNLARTKLKAIARGFRNIQPRFVVGDGKRSDRPVTQCIRFCTGQDISGNNISCVRSYKRVFTPKQGLRRWWAPAHSTQLVLVVNIFLSLPVFSSSRRQNPYIRDGTPVAEFVDPCLGDKVYFGIGLSYRSLTCRYDNPMPELTLSPNQWFMNLATVPSFLYIVVWSTEVQSP